MKKIFAATFTIALCVILASCSFYSFTSTQDIPEDIKSEIDALDMQLLALLDAGEAEGILEFMSDESLPTIEQLETFLAYAQPVLGKELMQADMRLVDVKSTGNAQISVPTNIGDITITPLCERNVLSILRMEEDDTWQNLIIIYGLFDDNVFRCNGVLWNFPLEEPTTDTR